MRRFPSLLLLALLLGLGVMAWADDAPPTADPASPPAPPAAAPDDPMPSIITLREAAALGRVRAHGYEPASYRRLHVRVENRTQEALHVDMCASYLRPRRSGSCQRLGIGPPVTPTPKKKRYPPGTVIVRLDPGETKDVQFHTCCLDAGLRAPSKQSFVVASDPLPPVREKVLRWWAENPQVPQGRVNSAIWANRGTVHTGPAELMPYRAQYNRTVASHGGTVYRLRGGELTSIDPDGVERILGTEIHQVIPVEGAVYSVQMGEDGQPDLMRLGITGAEAWSFVLDLPAQYQVDDILPAPDGNLVLLGQTDHLAQMGAGIHFWSARHGTLTNVLSADGREDLSTRRLDRRRFLLATKRPAKGPTYRAGERSGEQSAIFEFHVLDGKTGAVEHEKSFWNVRAVKSGPAGVFGLSHKGRLRRLVRMSWRDHGSSEGIAEILAIGDEGLWLRPEEGLLCLVKASTGRTILEPNLDRRVMEVYDLDPVTDDLVYLRGGEIWRLRSGTTEPERVMSGAGR